MLRTEQVDSADRKAHEWILINYSQLVVFLQFFSAADPPPRYVILLTFFKNLIKLRRSWDISSDSYGWYSVAQRQISFQIILLKDK